MGGWESQHITPALYDDRLGNKRFVPVLPPAGDERIDGDQASRRAATIEFRDRGRKLFWHPAILARSSATE
ncbi:MAG: hypothetical protein ABTS16_13940 [Candidatus Accumulibacter phosphatis]